MTLLEAQPELALARAPVAVSMPIEMVRSKKTGAAAFTLACDAPGVPTASMVVFHHVFTQAVSFVASLTGSYVKAGTAATAWVRRSTSPTLPTSSSRPAISILRISG